MQTFTFYASDDKLQNRGNTASEKIGVRTNNEKFLLHLKSMISPGRLDTSQPDSHSPTFPHLTEKARAKISRELGPNLEI